MHYGVVVEPSAAPGTLQQPQGSTVLGLAPRGSLLSPRFGFSTGFAWTKDRRDSLRLSATRLAPSGLPPPPPSEVVQFADCLPEAALHGLGPIFNPSIHPSQTFEHRHFPVLCGPLPQNIVIKIDLRRQHAQDLQTRTRPFFLAFALASPFSECATEPSISPPKHDKLKVSNYQPTRLDKHRRHIGTDVHARAYPASTQPLTLHGTINLFSSDYLGLKRPLLFTKCMSLLFALHSSLFVSLASHCLLHKK